MTDTVRISIPHSPLSFPMAELVENGVWAQIPNAAKAILAVIWNYHRKHELSCHPSRSTISAESGVHESTVSRALDDLEAMGLVQVVPQPGPRPNHYKVCWQDIRIRRVAAHVRNSPFPLPRKRFDVDLEQDEDGVPVTKYTRRDAGYHRMADGCIVRSAVETVIHDHLVAWRVPHWTDVTYSAMGIVMRNTKTGDLDRATTVDFIVGPNYLIERMGLPATQKEAVAYGKKLQAKTAAALAAGWKGFGVKYDERPGDWMLGKILPVWANATVDDAKRLRDKMKSAGKFSAGHEPSRWLDEMIADAEVRLSGKKPQRKARGLTVMEDDEHGFRVERRTTPDLVLMESAGTRGTQMIAPELVAVPPPAATVATAARAPALELDRAAQQAEEEMDALNDYLDGKTDTPPASSSLLAAACPGPGHSVDLDAALEKFLKE